MQSVLKWFPNDDFSTPALPEHLYQSCTFYCKQRTLFSPTYLIINLCLSVTGVNSWISVFSMAIVIAALIILVLNRGPRLANVSPSLFDF